MDLIVSTGPWQALMASAALRQLGIPPEKVSAIVMTATTEENLVEPCRRIHEAEGHHFAGAVRNSCVLQGMHAVSPAILEAVRSARRIWTCAIWDEIAAFMAWAGPEVRVAIFEDGMMSCRPPSVYGDQWRRRQVSRSLLWRSFIKRSLAERRLWLRKPDYQRVEMIVTCLDELYNESEMLPVPRVRLEMKYLRAALEAGAAPKILISPSDRPRAMVAGSNFAKGGLLTPSQEYGLIENSIEQLAGDYEVWWKPHPRADSLYTRYLQLRYPSLKTLDAELSITPLEGLIPCLDLKLFASPFSSSLLYARKLYGVETRRSSGFASLLPLMKDPIFEQIYKILEEHVPELGEAAPRLEV